MQRFLRFHFLYTDIFSSVLQKSKKRSRFSLFHIIFYEITHYIFESTMNGGHCFKAGIETLNIIQFQWNNSGDKHKKKGNSYEKECLKDS